MGWVGKRDGILELWLRLLALHVEESPDEEFLGRTIRDQWLLAFKGCFNGHVPHDLETFANTDHGQKIIRDAIASLMSKLKNAHNTLMGERWTCSEVMALLSIRSKLAD